MAAARSSGAKSQAGATARAAEARDRHRTERPARRRAPAVREDLREHIVLGYN